MTFLAARPRQPRCRGEAGTTLLELLVAMAVSTIIVGAAALALTMSLRTTEAAADSFGESNDAEMIAAYFVPDAQSATSIGQALTTGCAAEGGDDVVRMTGPGFAVGYRLEGARLSRWICEAGTGSARVLARQVTDAVPWSNGGHQVGMTVVMLTGHSFSLVGTQRTGTVDLAPLSTTNDAPVADLAEDCSYLHCLLGAGGSTDLDGVITSYVWDLGDGTTALTKDVDHVYATAGSYTVRLTVVDDDGASATTTRVLVVGANQPPTASFTLSCTGVTCVVDGTTSSDADGAVTSFTWSWGDGSPDGTGSTATHTYASAGSRSVTLTVTDNEGATATATRTLGPVGPTAAFTVDSCNVASCSVDASGSSDPDGTIASYSWSWGDSTAAGSGVTASHAYTVFGPRTITLTVTDDDGVTASTSRVVKPPVLVITTTTSPSYAATLTWQADTLAGTTVDVYRNGNLVGSAVLNDGSWIRTSPSRTQVSGSYRVCSRSPATACTNTVVVSL